MIKIGLTGGIGTGKSTVSRVLRGLGAAVIDADQLGHEAYAKGRSAYQSVIDEFGPGVVADNGEIDRKALGSLVFASPERRRKLEGIVWPVIRDSIVRRLAEEEAKHSLVAVVDAAVLIEAGWDDLVDQVWVVDAPEEVVVDRLRARGGLTEDQIKARVSAQLPRSERVRSATLLISNDGNVLELERRVTAAWESLTGDRNGTNGTNDVEGKRDR